MWDFHDLVPSATELRARRLQWYQNPMKDPTAHQNVLLSFWDEAPFESDTIFDENGRIRESACGGGGRGGSAMAGRRGWSRSVRRWCRYSRTVRRSGGAVVS